MIMNPGSSHELPEPEQARRPAWSVADGVWWIAMIAALIIADLARHALPGDSADFAHYAAGVPLVGFLAVTGYWHWRLRSTWARAATTGLAVAALALAIGWLKGQI